MAAFANLVAHRQNGANEPPPQDVVRFSRGELALARWQHAQNGRLEFERFREDASPRKLYQLMCNAVWHQGPEDRQIAFLAHGMYPEFLAHFAMACTWSNLWRHALWALHGHIYLDTLKLERDLEHFVLTAASYRDNLAGALNHFSVGLMHMVRCARQSPFRQRQSLRLPCWEEPLPLQDIAALAVQSMRHCLALRQEKCRANPADAEAQRAFVAAEANLSAALRIHQLFGRQVEVDRLLSNISRHVDVVRAGDLAVALAPVLAHPNLVFADLADEAQQDVDDGAREVLQYLQPLLGHLAIAVGNPPAADPPRRGNFNLQWCIIWSILLATWMSILGLQYVFPRSLG